MERILLKLYLHFYLRTSISYITSPCFSVLHMDYFKFVWWVRNVLWLWKDTNCMPIKGSPMKTCFCLCGPVTDCELSNVYPLALWQLGKSLVTQHLPLSPDPEKGWNGYANSINVSLEKKKGGARERRGRENYICNLERRMKWSTVCLYLLCVAVQLQITWTSKPIIHSYRRQLRSNDALGLYPIAFWIVLIDMGYKRYYWFLCGFQEVNAAILTTSHMWSPVDSTTRSVWRRRNRLESNVIPLTTDSTYRSRKRAERSGVVRGR